MLPNMPMTIDPCGMKDAACSVEKLVSHMSTMTSTSLVGTSERKKALNMELESNRYQKDY